MREVGNDSGGILHVGYGLLAKRSRTHLSSQCYRREQEAQSQRRRCLLWLDGTSCAGSATSRRSHGQASVSFAKYRLSSCFVQRWYSRSGCGLWAESCRSAFVLVLRHRHHLSTDAVKQTKAVVLSSLDVPGTAPAIISTTCLLLPLCVVPYCVLVVSTCMTPWLWCVAVEKTLNHLI